LVLCQRAGGLLTQIRILCFTHPQNWTIIREKNEISKTLTGLDEKSSSWVVRADKRGARIGMHKKPSMLLGNRYVVMQIAWEKLSSYSFQTLESIIDSNSTNGGRDPVYYATASKIIIDTEEGIAYIVESTKDALPIDKLQKFFGKLAKDTSIPLSGFRPFAWDKNKVEDFTAHALESNFDPHKIRGHTDLVKIVAQGELRKDQQWIQIQDSLRNGEWTALAFQHNDVNNEFIFTLQKNRNAISIPGRDPMSDELLVSRMELIKGIFEKTHGMQLNQYCFSDHHLTKYA